jgi:hypothetical protein
MDKNEEYIRALATLQAKLQKAQQLALDKLVDRLPPGYAVQYSLLKIVPSDVHFEPSRKPIGMKGALSAHAFMHAGLLPNEHRRAIAIISDDEMEMRVEDWLKQQSRDEILRFPGYGAKTLQLLIDVLKWHGHDTSNLER